MAANGTASMPKEETKLEALRRRKEEREAADKKEGEAREVALLELEEDCIAKYGKRGVDFEIVDAAPVALFVVTPPEFVVAKRFNAAKDKGEEEVIQFVMPCLRAPDATLTRTLFMKHGGLAWRCALAALALYEVGGADKRGKY